MNSGELRTLLSHYNPTDLVYPATPEDTRMHGGICGLHTQTHSIIKLDTSVLCKPIALSLGSQFWSGEETVYRLKDKGYFSLMDTPENSRDDRQRAEEYTLFPPLLIDLINYNKLLCISALGGLIYYLDSLQKARSMLQYKDFRWFKDVTGNTYTHTYTYVQHYHATPISHTHIHTHLLPAATLIFMHYNVMCMCVYMCVVCYGGHHMIR